MVGAIPTYRIMRKQKLKKLNKYLKIDNEYLEKENAKLKAEIDDAKSTLQIYRKVLDRVAEKEVVQIELNKAFKELLCKK